MRTSVYLCSTQIGTQWCTIVMSSVGVCGMRYSESTIIHMVMVGKQTVSACCDIKQVLVFTILFKISVILFRASKTFEDFQDPCWLQLGMCRKGTYVKFYLLLQVQTSVDSAVTPWLSSIRFPAHYSHFYPQSVNPPTLQSSKLFSASAGDA